MIFHRMMSIMYTVSEEPDVPDELDVRFPLFPEEKSIS